MDNPSDPKAVMSVYGFAEEATNFDLRHPLWHQAMPRLGHTIDLAFTRIQTMDTPEEKFVYFYGTLIAEDFMEIFLVAVNGYGVAAMKLLRSVYEATVTLRYLHDHPDEVGAFMAYDHVQQYKLMRPIVETFGTGVLPPETVADVECRYEEVKKQFMVTDCKKCDTKRVNYTWNKLDFVAMAKKTGAVGTLIVPGYFLPLRHAHSTFRAITDRLEKRDGHLGFQRESQPGLADEALMTAHNCLLVALEMPDNWPCYDVVAQPTGGGPAQRISVKSRTFKRGGGTFVTYKIADEFDWLAIVLLPGADQKNRRVFIVPRSIADARSKQDGPTAKTQERYWRQDKIAGSLSGFEDNYCLSPTGRAG